MHLKSLWQKFMSAKHRWMPDREFWLQGALPCMLATFFALATVLAVLDGLNARQDDAPSAEMQAQLEAEKLLLDAKLTEVQTALGNAQSLLDQISAANSNTQTLLEQAGAISVDIEAMKEAYNKLEQKEQQRWVVPMRYTVLTSPFGYRDHPVEGEAKFHYGVDLVAELGTPVVAARSGTVELANYDDVSGQHVYIDHMDGFGSCYMHMDRYIVTQGQFVLAGQVIGYCGNTGATTGVHLHFEVYKDHVLVDPAEYIDFY